MKCSNKLLLFWLVIFFQNINAQTLIKFDENSMKIDKSVTLQVKNIYSSAKNNSEIHLSFLSKKEKKKFNQKTQMRISGIRANKLIQFLIDSLNVDPVNMALQIDPFEAKGKTNNDIGRPAVGVSWTQANYKNFMSISGIYHLLVLKSIHFIVTGEINDSVNGAIKRKIECDKANYIYGDYTHIYIPPNSLDCDCDKINFELKEFFTPSQLLLSGLTTTSGGKPLITGGMIYVMAYCNGKEVPIIKGKNIEITFTSIDQSFNLFYGKERNKFIDWKQDKKAEIDLIPFEMEEEMEGDGSKRLKLLTDRFGWINCDAFIEDGPRTELEVNIKNASKKTYARLIFNDIKSLLPGYFTDETKAKVTFKNIPENKKASLFIYELMENNKIKWAIQEIKTGRDKEIYNLNFQTTNYQEFKKVADKIW